MALVHDIPEHKNMAFKKGEIETDVKDIKAEKTETIMSNRESKENHVKRKRKETLHEDPEPHIEKVVEKRRKTETEDNDVQKGNLENLSSNFHVGKQLGKGGFGSVFSAIRKSDGKKVAVKLIRKKMVRRFITLPGETCRLPIEVALMKLVCKPPHCPYVIELLEWYETPKFFILVMERPDPCVDLLQFLEGRSMDESMAKKIMRKVIHAVRHCHDRGVFHRDIKLQNILVNPETLDVKLIDFGCGDLLKKTRYEKYSGTPLYYPPEWIVEKEYEAEPATVWSLGILLYCFLCGKVPFPTQQCIVRGLLNFPDCLSEAYRSLIWYCLQRDPRRRPTLKKVLRHLWFRDQETVQKEKPTWCENKRRKCLY